MASDLNWIRREGGPPPKGRKTPGEVGATEPAHDLRRVGRQAQPGHDLVAHHRRCRRGAGEHPRRGKTKVPISPIRLHGAEPAVARPAPLLGQDTDRVLADILGLSKDELAALHAAGVIEPVKT